MRIHNAMITIATTTAFNLYKVLTQEDVTNATVNRALRANDNNWNQMVAYMQGTGTTGTLSIGIASTVGDNDNICQIATTTGKFETPDAFGLVALGDFWFKGAVNMKVAVTLFQ